MCQIKLQQQDREFQTEPAEGEKTTRSLSKEWQTYRHKEHAVLEKVMY